MGRITKQDFKYQIEIIVAALNAAFLDTNGSGIAAIWSDPRNPLRNLNKVVRADTNGVFSVNDSLIDAEYFGDKASSPDMVGGYWNAAIPSPPWEEAYSLILKTATENFLYPVPSAPIQLAQTELIRDLMASQLWDLLDSLYVFRGNTDLGFASMDFCYPTSFGAADIGSNPPFDSGGVGMLLDGPGGPDHKIVTAQSVGGNFGPNTGGITYKVTGKNNSGYDLADGDESSGGVNIQTLPTSTRLMLFDSPIHTIVTTDLRNKFNHMARVGNTVSIYADTILAGSYVAPVIPSFYDNITFGIFSDGSFSSPINSVARIEFIARGAAFTPSQQSMFKNVWETYLTKV